MKQHIFSTSEIGDYAVCPEAWRLKHVEGNFYEKTIESAAGKTLRKEWIKAQDLSSQLRGYATIAYALLLILVMVVFLLDEHKRLNGPTVIRQSQTFLNNQNIIPSQILLLLLVLGAIIFIWDLFDRKSKGIKKTAGIDEKAETLALRGSDNIPGKRYCSEKLKLLSKPDALFKIDKHIIPVDRRATIKKIRDRHVLQLLVHMRLIEEIEGKRPPYGILLMGPKPRTVRVRNSEDRQRWLDSIIKEMESIISGVPAQPKPTRIKCKNCDVRGICDYKYKQSDTKETN